jgi:hypothetical protein
MNLVHGLSACCALIPQHPLSAKVGTSFADRRRSLGIVRLRTKNHGVFFFYVYPVIAAVENTNSKLSTVRSLSLPASTGII